MTSNESSFGDYRVVPYGYRLQQRRRKHGPRTWWKRAFGSKGSDTWETILETQTEDASQIENLLESIGETASWLS